MVDGMLIPDNLMLHRDSDRPQLPRVGRQRFGYVFNLTCHGEEFRRGIHAR